jgi:hypothetical protein
MPRCGDGPTASEPVCESGQTPTNRRLGVVTFEVAAQAYDAFMGRWPRLLSDQLADFAGVRAGQRVLDVGCSTDSSPASSSHGLGPTRLVISAVAWAARGRVHGDPSIRRSTLDTDAERVDRKERS